MTPEEFYNRLLEAIRASEERQAKQVDEVKDAIHDVQGELRGLRHELGELSKETGKLEIKLDGHAAANERQDKLIEVLRGEVEKLKTQAELTSLKIAGIISAGGILGMVLEELLKLALKH